MQSRPDEENTDLNRQTTDTKSAPKSARPSRVLLMRTSSAAVVGTPNGMHRTPLRVAATVAKHCFSPGRQPYFCINLAARFASIAGNRPVSAVVEQSAAGSPLAVTTPNGSHLRRQARLGVLTLFSNQPAPRPSSSDSDAVMDDAFYESAAYQAIKRVSESVKRRELDVTQGALAAQYAANRKAGFKRKISQAKAMTAAGGRQKDASATKYANAAQLFDGKVKWEWLHLIAHAIEGDASQQAGNVVAGTAHANTNMLLVEMQMQYIAAQYPAGFRLIIEADLLPADAVGESTHIAKTIRYRIKTPDFEIPFEFDAQETARPHRSFAKYVRVFLEEFITAQKALVATKKATVTSTSSTLFAEKPAAQPRRSKRLQEMAKRQQQR